MPKIKLSMADYLMVRRISSIELACCLKASFLNVAWFRLERNLKIKQRRNLNVLADRHLYVQLHVLAKRFCCLDILCSSGSLPASDLWDDSLEMKELSQPTKTQKC